MTTSRQVLDVARGELGTVESPRGSNRTKYGRAFGMDGYPWCSMFMWWVFKRAHGNGDLYPEIAYTPAVARWFTEQGRYGETPKVGAIALFDFPDGVDRIQHVGIVEAVHSDGTLQTIEGNTSSNDAGSQANGGGVFRRTRRPSLVVMYGYPRYSDPKPVAKYTLREVLSMGDRGDNVKALQRALHVKVDGDFGPKTRDAVMAFQHRRGLVVDGVVGERTALRLGWRWDG